MNKSTGEVNGDLMTTNWLVSSGEMPMAILWRSRISNASGDDSQVVKSGNKSTFTFSKMRKQC